MAHRGIKDEAVRAIYDAAVTAGWVASVQGNGHLRLTSPTGARLTISMTLRGRRQAQNCRAEARRLGLLLP